MVKIIQFMRALLLCLIISGQVGSGVIHAQSTGLGNPNHQFDAVNILFIIDQSGSMGGEAFGGHPMFGPSGTDPFQLRFVGSQYGINWLSDFHDTIVLNTKPVINVAQIAFGSYPRELLDWVQIDTSAANWPQQLDEYLFDISADRFGAINLQETNFLSAIQRARTYFPLPNSTSNALNAIIILTDGAPCISTDSRFHETQEDGRIVYNCSLNNSNRLEAMQDHLHSVQHYVQTQFPSNVNHLYVIGLDDDDEYWSHMENIWADIVCQNVNNCSSDLHYKHVVDPTEIGMQMRLILNEIIQQVVPNINSFTQVSIPPGSFNVAPYQQLLRIEVYKSGTNPISDIAISSVNGAESTQHPIGLDTPIQIYRFENPVPGEWVIGVQGGVTEVAVETISSGLRLNMNDEGEVFNAMPLVAELVNGENELFAVSPENDQYPLTVTANFYDATLVDRYQRPLVDTLQLQHDTIVTDSYRFQDNWLPKNSGRFEVRITATYVDDNGQTVVFVDEVTVADNIQIAPAVVEWNGIQPVSERVQNPFNIHARILNGNTGSPARNSDQVLLRVTLEDSNGDLLAPLNLPNTSLTAGEISAAFSIDEPGFYIAQVEAGVLDNNGDFVRLGNASIPQQLEARPMRSLSLVFLQPNEPYMDAQHFSLVPLELVMNTHVPIQIGLLDNSTGDWVSVEHVTDGVFNRPELLLNDGNDSQDITGNLIEIQPGLYTLVLDDLGMGDFRFNARIDLPQDALTGDYVWASNSAIYNLSRGFSTSLIYLFVGILVFLIVAALIVVLTLGSYRYLSYAPLTGSLILAQRQVGTHDYMPLKTIDLDTKPRNHRSFGKKQLAAPFEHLEVSTRRDLSASENGFVYIEKVRLDGKSVNVQQDLLRPQREIVVGRSPDGAVEYLLVKDMDGLNSIIGGDFLGAIGSR